MASAKPNPDLTVHEQGAGRVDVAAAVETGARGVAKPAVQVSFDDGTTWRPAPLVKVGQRWLAAVVHPAGAKFVSLKARARDAAGNAVDQTIIRAYGLR
ncbi:hypothetical protein [Saccharothrix texasensis]|uniref:Uncharacterized protein n=1 Tax=Saccharothrix texasensis TaxID=103734 RepID=A0A3N1HJB6_9PSEU|nr:hypothetical protein [Saccharothrix texasensis]ROP42657.1 hypothetical protein EDD40_8165 [Saccharothrix texasensis]